MIRFYGMKNEEWKCSKKIWQMQIDTLHWDKTKWIYWKKKMKLCICLKTNQNTKDEERNKTKQQQQILSKQ